MARMTDDLERRIAEVAEALKERDVQLWRRTHLKDRMAGVREEIDKLTARLGAEEADVERLEKLSLTRILASLKGSRDDDLALERAEADEARYRLAEAKERLRVMQDEYAVADGRASQLSGVDAVYQGLLQEKEQRLATSGSAQ